MILFSYINVAILWRLKLAAWRLELEAWTFFKKARQRLT